MQMETNIPLNLVNLIKEKRGRKYDAPFSEACPRLIQTEIDLQASWHDMIFTIQWKMKKTNTSYTIKISLN